MIYEFGLRNYFSFKEGVNISFRVNESCPDDVSQGQNFVSILGIKGANGSGKTNILRALSFLPAFCTKSFTQDPEDSLGVRSFFGSSKPSEFSVDFSVGSVNYLYVLHVDNQRVHHESLFRKLKRQTRLFERENDTVIYATEKFSRLKSIKLRSNASIISISHHHEQSILEDIYKYFDNWLGNVNFGGLVERGPSINAVSKLLKDTPSVLEFVRDFIADCDGGVSDITIQEVVKEDGEKLFTPLFSHEIDGKTHKITHVTESSGTKNLFKNLMYYKIVLATGGLLILDEFDINLHPHILPKLLNLFVNSETNPLNAQMIFSTHNGEIIDWLGRYRCYLVNKENNESYAYRLDEIPGDLLRNDRPIAPAYNRGDIGGIPKL